MPDGADPRATPAHDAEEGASALPASGSIFDRKYVIHERLGAGGFGIVYRAEHILLRRSFALKLLRPDLVHNARARERFQDEALALCRFSHPDAVSLRDFGIACGAPYMVVDYSDGEGLDRVIARGPVSPERAARITAQILDVAAAAHREGIIHRDLKPMNVLIERGSDGRERVKVLDFGLARLLAEHGRTTAGRIVGTLEYLAPEQARGVEVDGRCDVHGCGLILYELLTGRRARQGSALEEVADAVLRSPVPPCDLRPDLGIPEALEAIVLRSIEQRPSSRYASAGEFRDALDDFLATRPPEEARDEAALHASRERRSRRWRRDVVILVLGAALGASAALACVALLGLHPGRW